MCNDSADTVKTLAASQIFVGWSNVQHVGLTKLRRLLLSCRVVLVPMPMPRAHQTAG